MFMGMHLCVQVDGGERAEDTVGVILQVLPILFFETVSPSGLSLTD